MRFLIGWGALVMGVVLAGCSDGDDPVSTPAPGPKIVAMSPAPGQSFVSSDQEFVVEFSEPMDRRSVEEAYQVVMGGKRMSGAYRWNSEGTIMRFRPSASPPAGAEVEVRWGMGMRSQGGDRLVDQSGRPVDPFEFRCSVFAAPSNFSSNGERIYFTGTSTSGEPITFTMGEDFDEDFLPGYSMMGSGMMGSGMMGSGMMGSGEGGYYGMSCASCHGPDGSGGRYLAMGAVRTPNIQYAVLTGQVELEEKEDPEEEEEGHPHEPYDESALKRAITEGVEPGGEELNPFMPRWSMSGQDLDDLLEFLKSL